ncbi:hypothetical protein IAU60_001964 [Kwoniella sp. DSM 27419]
MSAVNSHAASPASYPPHNPEGELFSLDFLALAGIDSGMGEVTSPQSPVNGTAAGSGRTPQWDHAGPSTYASGHRQGQNGSEDGLGGEPLGTAGSSRGSKRGNTGADRDDYGQGGRDNGSMEVDQTAGTELSRSNLINQEDATIQDFDSLQAALLQHQLQGFHMQSPLGFDITNPPFPLAQMFLASPASQMAQLHRQQAVSESGQEADQRKQVQGNGGEHTWAVSQGAGGMPTPGASGEIIPQSRQDIMSPMHLEYLARSQADLSDPNMLPLLSPALSQSTSASNFNSPANTMAFAQQQSQAGQPQTSHGGNKSPLEQLQEQQRQFQEQLAALQQRQIEMQATAAAVVAASNNSPYIGSSGPSSGASKPVTTPGVNGTPQSFFSPLTSPALEPTGRMQQHNGHRHHPFSPAFAGGQSRTPHPLSALSSPALNPVGSSGGAQQTLSPALGPQNGADLNDPDYLQALVGMIDGNGPPGSEQYSQQQHQHQIYHSPSITATTAQAHGGMLASPALNPVGPGPHRHSLGNKSRPSPMLKPTNHRSHHQRVPSGPNGLYSVPTSPAIQKYHPTPPSMGGMGYLPPSSIDHRHLHSSAASLSTASTPSPVDLSQIMPPPPVPNGNSKSTKGVAPMTPASLMNLGSATVVPDSVLVGQAQHEHLPSERSQSAAPAPPAGPKRAPAPAARSSARKVQATATTAGAAAPAPPTKGATATKLAPAGAAARGGKRALAIRPAQGGVGVKAATKAAAASASASASALPSEPETRKTSHKAAEQKRRDSLKAGFDELRLLLPPINVEALDAETGEPIPGSSAPRLLPKSSLVPDDNPNRGVSKVALLRFSNEYIDKLKGRVERRDVYIDRLREEVRRLRAGEDTPSVEGDYTEDDIEDILEFDWREGEDEEFNPPDTPDDDGELGVDGDEDGEDAPLEDEDMDVEDDEDEYTGRKRSSTGASRRGKPASAQSITKSPAIKASNPRRPSLNKSRSSSGGTVTLKTR